MKCILLILFGIIFCSCGRNNTGEKFIIDLFATPESELTKISQIANDVEYIPLETSEGSLIPYISDIKSAQGKIFIKTNTSELICIRTFPASYPNGGLEALLVSF